MERGKILCYSDSQVFAYVEVNQNGELSISGDSMCAQENQRFKSEYEQMYEATAIILAAKARGYNVVTQRSPTGQILLNLTQ